MLTGSILQQLVNQHLEGSQRVLSLGVYYKNTLVALCHALEDCILTSESEPLVLAAFQRGKWYLLEADRYASLAERSRQVVIMATPEAGFSEHATSQRADVNLVQLTTEDPVAQEWHLIILSPTYTAMVLCQELSEADYGVEGHPTEDRLRKFYGLWTFERQLVQEAVDLAIAHVGTYNPQLQAQLQQQVQEIQAEESQHANPEEFYAVVTRVVEYLKRSQNSLTSAGSHLNLDNNLVSNELQAFLRIAQLIDLTDTRNPRASMEVAALSEMMGQLLDLPAWQVRRLRLASLLHRIGVLQKAETIFTPSRPDYTQEEAPSCPLTCALMPGAQVLRTMPRLRAIAQIITHQEERWDGSGQPAGLAGDDIPLESRILGLVSQFQRRTSTIHRPNGDNEAELATWQAELAQALADCQAEEGQRWDPKLVDMLALVVAALQQGIHLPVKFPKVSSSIWLLDSLDQAEALPESLSLLSSLEMPVVAGEVNS